MAKKQKRTALVRLHLENVSSELLARHPDIIRKFVGRNSGIYTLYRRDRLYYIGLAKSLSGRLKAHLRDRHKQKWDRFSIFLTVNDEHIKEIEALILRVTLPKGNRLRGNVKASTNMLPHIRKAIREKQSGEMALLLGRKMAARKQRLVTDNGSKALKFFPNGARLRATHKGETFTARLRKDGTVWFKGTKHASLRSAAIAAIGRPVYGWWFWRAERGKNHWVRLSDFKRAGTAMI
jgi:hypothetical protein